MRYGERDLVTIIGTSTTPVLRPLIEYNQPQTLELAKITTGTPLMRPEGVPQDRLSFFSDKGNGVTGIRYGESGGGLGFEFTGLLGQTKERVKALYFSPGIEVDLSKSVMILGSHGAVAIWTDQERAGLIGITALTLDSADNYGKASITSWRADEKEAPTYGFLGAAIQKANDVAKRWDQLRAPA